ncbi:FXYD domain-containing ion transport regulator 3 [Alligator mississippiensis]|nr:FXYD domain-containing ion transport regulator 3 [Alligator mississippiensis]
MLPGLQVLLAGLCLLAPLVSAQADGNDPFHYDWHRLRMGGLVVAAVLCVMGIVVLLSGKCKCRRASRRPPETSKLLVPGAASA